VGLVLAAAGAGLYRLGYTWAGFVFLAAGVVIAAFMVYFFRDPERDIAPAPGDILAGADGWIRQIEQHPGESYLKADAVRVSTFLTPLDVHVNRSPLAGRVRALAYTPGRHFLTIRKESSEYNEHSSILIENASTRCLVKQIVGPIVRRVVYWLHEGQELRAGDRIGIMKFGSRLDVYLPAADVEVVVRRGDRVFAGRTVIARLRRKEQGS
jgi:phosphatidylserine decarboxylase